VLRVLRQHGLSSTSMNNVFKATVLAKLLYCASAWSGFCMAVYRERLDTFIRRCKRLRNSDVNIPEVAEMFESTDKALFSRIIRNDKHVLQHYLPERCTRNSSEDEIATVNFLYDTSYMYYRIQ